MNNDLNNILSMTYKQFNTPADQLATNHQQRESFADAIRSKTDQSDMDTDTVIHRLLTMRKAGLLPRLRR